MDLATHAGSPISHVVSNQLPSSFALTLEIKYPIHIIHQGIGSDQSSVMAEVSYMCPVGTELTYRSTNMRCRLGCFGISTLPPHHQQRGERTIQKGYCSLIDFLLWPRLTVRSALFSIRLLWRDDQDADTRPITLSANFASRISETPSRYPCFSAGQIEERLFLLLPPQVD